MAPREPADDELTREDGLTMDEVGLNPETGDWLNPDEEMENGERWQPDE